MKINSTVPIFFIATFFVTLSHSMDNLTPQEPYFFEQLKLLPESMDNHTLQEPYFFDRLKLKLPWTEKEFTKEEYKLYKHQRAIAGYLLKALKEVNTSTTDPFYLEDFTDELTKNFNPFYAPTKQGLFLVLNGYVRLQSPLGSWFLASASPNEIQKKEIFEKIANKVKIDPSSEQSIRMIDRFYPIIEVNRKTLAKPIQNVGPTYYENIKKWEAMTNKYNRKTSS